MSERTQLDRIEDMLRRLLTQTAPKRPEDDEKIFKTLSAKYWNGDDYAGNRMSECPPDFLRAYAKYKRACVWANKKEGDPNKAQYAEKDESTAKLATEWATYQEAAGVVATPKPSSKPADDFGTVGDQGDIPF